MKPASANTCGRKQEQKMNTAKALSEIVSLLMERDGISRIQAMEELRDCRDCILQAMETGEEDPADVLMDMLGLEPDYLIDLL
jgi:hypothetical protein